MQSLKIMQKLFIILFISMTSSLWGASSVVVNSTADAAASAPNVNADSTLGAGIITLRSAIEFSQGTAAVAPTTITFDIPTSDPGFQPATNSWLIQPLAVMGASSAYNINTKPIIIDGYAGNTAHPASPNTNAFAAGSNAVLRIEIKGTGVGDGVSAPSDAFNISVPGCIFKGLCINNYLGSPATFGSAFIITTDNSTVSGCFIGTDVTGSVSVDMFCGYVIFFGNNHIFGGNNPADSNVIASSNSFFGCILAQFGSALVKRNYIGTDKTGQIAFDRTNGGIYFFRMNSSIIDTNLVSGCSGFAIQTSSLTSTTVVNNLVGTDATGTRVLGNGNSGISIPFRFTAGNVIQNNVVAGCGSVAVLVAPWIYAPFSVNNNSIIGNKIGLDITGTKVLGNGRSGIVIENSTNTQVGINPAGINPSDRNIVSGNEEYGLFIGSRAATTTVDGNIIGSDISGQLIVDASGNAFGNGFDGIHIGVVQGPVTTTLVGDAQPILANEIVNNLGNGVSIVAASNTNTVAGNFIGVNQNSKKLGNQLNGVNIDAAFNNIIG